MSVLRSLLYIYNYLEEKFRKLYLKLKFCLKKKYSVFLRKLVR